MLALVIILAVLAALLLPAVGVDASYGPEGPAAALKLGPLRIRLFPRPEKKPRAKKPKKEKAPKASKAEKAPKPKQKLDIHFLLDIAKMGLHALNRFRRRLSVDRFELSFTAAGSDPCDTALLYGYVNMALNELAPLAHRAFRVRQSRVETYLDFDAEKISVSGRIVLSIQIWEVLYIALAFAIEFLDWKWRQPPKPKAPKAPKTPAAPPPEGESAPQNA